MLICTIIHDRTMCDASGGDDVSLLTMPLGATSVLEHICARARAAGSDEIVVLSDRASTRDAIHAMAANCDVPVRIVSADELDSHIHSLEPSDRLLFIDPRDWPTNDYDFTELLREAKSFSGAIHAIAMGSDMGDASERVLLDRDGRVRSIRRFYQGVTRVDRAAGSIAYAYVPVAAMADIHYDELTALPVALARRGVLVRDIPLRCDLFDATTEHDFLALSELILMRTLAGVTPDQYSRLDTQMVSGRGAIVHASARLVGPVIVQAGASVGANATIIGPTVVGASSRIGAGALVAQAILPKNAIVEAGASVRHCVAPPSVSRETPALGADPMDFQAPPQLDARGSEAVAPELEDAGIVQGGALIGKRAFDIFASALGLIVLSPLMLIVAILIKLDSRGPVFFRHYREGRHGKVFPCLKFRTMRSDAHQLQRKLLEQNDLDGPHFKISRDPRITRLGRLLRNTNIDELPQLFNVLIGQMSL
ncbi:MAG: sugar transferase, partial [Phycisphaerales bacterium]|nr:sugar transferase [Phycisphaerales bacterium]